MKYLILALVVFGCGGHSGNTADAAGDGNGSDGNGSDGNGSDGSHNPTSVSLTLTDRPSNAAMFTFVVAYQDGGGPWTLAPAPTGDTYSFPINSSAYGVAWTCIANVGAVGTGGQIRQVDLAYFAVAERTSLTMPIPNRCTDRITRVALGGTVSNLGTGNIATFDAVFGDISRAVNAVSGAYSMETPPGTHDLFVLRDTATGVGNDVIIDRAAVVRGVAVTGNTTQNVDFGTSAATQSFAVDVGPGLGAARVTTVTDLYTANGTLANLVTDTAAPYVTESLDAAQMAAGDVYNQIITVVATGQTGATSNATATPAAESYVAPAPLGGATSTVPTTTPYPEVMTTWAAYASTIGYAWAATQNLEGTQCGNSSTTCVVWTALLSPGVTGSSPSFRMPDLSALTGWSANLAMTTGTPVTGSVDAITSSGGAGDLPLVTPPPAGTQRTFAASDFTVTP